MRENRGGTAVGPHRASHCWRSSPTHNAPGWACKLISRTVASGIDAPLDNTETPWYTRRWRERGRSQDITIAPPRTSGYVNQDQITLCVFPLFSRARTQEPRSPRPRVHAFENIWVRLRATTGSTYPATLRGPGRAYHDFGLHPVWRRVLNGDRSICVTRAMIIAELRTFNVR